MPLSSHYNETVTVKRLTDVVDSEYQVEGKKIYTTHIANLACEIQPLDPSITQDIAIGFGKGWLMFCANEDIIEGDRIVREDGTEYRVTGIENYDEFRGNPQHMEIVIRAFKS